MYYFLTILIDTGAGFFSMLPFLILLEILARKEIPYIPLKHLIGDGIFCFFLCIVRHTINTFCINLDIIIFIFKTYCIYF